MGSQQSSQIMPNNQSIIKILHALYFTPVANSPKQTVSLGHRYFSNQFARIEKSKFDRSMNPFCPVRIQGTDSWETCCIVSPLMALISPVSQVSNKRGQLDKKLTILPVFERLQVQVEVQGYINLQKGIGLIVFSQPYWRVGWAGVSYIQNLQQLSKLQLKSVFHPQRILPKTYDIKTFYNQQVTRVKIPRNAQLRQDFCIQINGIQGSLICKIFEKKTYIIGVQITSNEVKFFNKKLFQTFHQSSKQYIKKNGGQKQILKAIDIHEFQIETQL